jgi:penicillin-binding protein 1A
VFALMTLIHDYHGDPDQTYYTSKFLPAGWLAEDPTWSVHTAEESYQGSINVTKATIVSDNTVFAQMAVDIGPEKMDAMAHAMGITTTLNDLPAEVIGGLKLGVTPLEMADAYATIANGGWHVPPTILTKVVYPDGTVQNFGDPPKTQVFSYGEAYAAIKVLKQVITSGTGTAANYGCPAAGKTGTANSLNNAWFVGFTPKLSTAVWVGYPQGNIPMADGFGGALAAPIWHDFMSSISNGYCGDWSPPSEPFQGTAYFGAHAVTGDSNVGTGSTTATGASATAINNGTPAYTAPVPTRPAAGAKPAAPRLAAPNAIQPTGGAGTAGGQHR